MLPVLRCFSARSYRAPLYEVHNAGREARQWKAEDQISSLCDPEQHKILNFICTCVRKNDDEIVFKRVLQPDRAFAYNAIRRNDFCF